VRHTNLPLGYVRAFIIVMVVLHHAVLAYYVKGPLPSHGLALVPRWWQAFPVVDPAKWSAFTPFVLFNDSYSMGVLFFVSGMFSWGSLKRKGPLPYFRDRLYRLVIPLNFMALLGPLTYYTVYLQGGMHDGFWHEWFTLHSWPSGPAWFLEALLAFDVIAILLFWFAPAALEATGRWLAAIESPFRMILVVTLVSVVLFVPALLQFGFYSSGILFLPVSRVVQNLAYFLVGLALGSANAASAERDAGLISAGSGLARNWLPLSGATIAAFVLWQGLNHLSHAHYGNAIWITLTGITFCLSTATSIFTVLAIFLRFVTRPNRAWDSLLACSFGIYLVHYVIVAWTQYAFLSIPAPGWFKGLAVFSIALALSWGVAALARRSRLIARVI
jgi:hypothetical protein